MCPGTLPRVIKMRNKIFVILAIYLSQILFTPLIHFIGEGSERDCADCYAGEVVNSSCNDANGPCKNPAHHHHTDHRHDPAQCTFCKTFFQDIEYVPISYEIIYKCFSTAFQSTFNNSGMITNRLFPARAPPV